MWPAVHDVLSSDVDDVATDGAGRVESQRLVLLDSEHVQLALVDGPLVNRVGHGGIDQLAANEGENANTHTHTDTHTSFVEGG